MNEYILRNIAAGLTEAELALTALKEYLPKKVGIGITFDSESGTIQLEATGMVNVPVDGVEHKAIKGVHVSAQRNEPMEVTVVRFITEVKKVLGVD